MQSFDELNLSEPLTKAISALGYTTPSPIQAQALPILLGEPTDFMGLAATGTGKTATFSIPLLEKIDPKLKKVQGLILCPTRELALQVAGQIDLLGKFKGIKALPIYGGASYGDQIYGLKSGATIVVGTPGRVIDHMEKGTLSLENVSTLILDEADEMISMGFKEDLEKVLDASPRDESQIWLFSATMSKEVRKVADTYLRKPKQIQVNRTEMLSTTVEQIYYYTHESDKPEVLCKLIEAADDFYGIIFCQTKALVTDLTQYLLERGYKVDCLHGDKDQNSRERTMNAFRTKKVNMLVCTDVASRGLDVKDITHVINYSIPRELDLYVHRIGRTARSGKSGIAMSLVTNAHRVLIGRIESMTKSRMKEGRIPSNKEIGTKRMLKVLGQFKEQKNHQKAIDLLGEEWMSSLSEMKPEEIAGRFLVMASPDLFIDRPETKPRYASNGRGASRSEGRSEGRRD
jgi:ATP-dependent RNA helicase DeaD